MKPVASAYGVIAYCPVCQAKTLFDYKSSGGKEYGYVAHEGIYRFQGNLYKRRHWRLLCCSGCGLGGLAKFYDNGDLPAKLLSFHPRAIPTVKLPDNVPDGIAKEFREAAICASVEAWRGASALIRSVLEKTLKANGYIKGSLETKIDEAAIDGVITKARSQKAHEDIRVLGNEVVHDDWRVVTEGEVFAALHYAQRVLEDLYDDRVTVEKILIAKDRIVASTTGS